jgi:hypothetical protein
MLNLGAMMVRDITTDDAIVVSECSPNSATQRLSTLPQR